MTGPSGSRTHPQSTTSTADPPPTPRSWWPPATPAAPIQAPEGEPKLAGRLARAGAGPGERRYGPPPLGVLDQGGEAFQPGLFPLRADDPPDRSPLIPGCLGREEVPGLFVGTETLLVGVVQPDGLGLLVRVDARPLPRSLLERCGACGCHLTESGQLA